MATHTGSDSERINGLFGDAIKWLLKNVGVKAVDWLSTKAHEFIDDKTKETDKKVNGWNYPTLEESDYEFEMPRCSDDADIEQNPGPVV